MKTLSISNRLGLKISFIYFIIAGCWIFFSDRFLAGIIDDSALLVQMQTYKGLFFVLVTSGLLYYLIKKNTYSIERSRQRLEEMVEQKQTLIGELHHRVKNNMAIIVGLIELQAAELSGESQDLLKTTQYRIYSIAEIQDLLFREKNLTRIPFHEFINHITASLMQSQNDAINVHVDEVVLNINQAIPLGLLINELLSQVKLNGFHRDDFQMKFELLHNDDETISVNIIFDNISTEILQKLQNEQKHVEATLIRSYSKQLKTKSIWKNEGEGSVHFNLRFKKSERKGSSSAIVMPKAS